MSTINIVYYAVWILLTIYTFYFLLTDRREPSSTLMWLMLAIFLPIIGPCLFFLFGPQTFEKTAERRKRAMSFAKHPLLAVDDTENAITPTMNAQDLKILKLAKEVSQYSPTHGNLVEFLPDPETAFKAMREAIDEAKHFVHLEYYIISSDEVTKQLLDTLTKALSRGVEVRILYDALGSLFLKRIHFRKLLDKGAKLKGFMPLHFLPQRFHIHFRNHRKILIIDGQTAFTGGTNIGKEYLGTRSSKQWRDYTVRIKGPVVSQLEDVFAKDWQFTTHEDLSGAKYYPQVELAGDSFLQVIESGPDTAFRTLHQAVFMAINSAQHEVVLTTPYFIPDPAMEAALISASLRGVKVTLLLPAKSDAPFVRWASRSFYEDFLKAGVKIYEFLPTVLHAKLLTVDDRWTILGSGNMDMRSFKLNFELNLLLYGMKFAAEAEKQMRDDLKKSTEIRWETFKNRNTGEIMLENFFRLFSPIL